MNAKVLLYNYKRGRKDTRDRPRERRQNMDTEKMMAALCELYYDWKENTICPLKREIIKRIKQIERAQKLEDWDLLIVLND